MDAAESRVQRLAINKLRSLGVQAYVAEGVVLGRLRVDPARFAGVDLTRDHNFVVQRADEIQFVPPSPFSHLGAIRYYDARTEAELVSLVERRFAESLARAREVQATIARFAPSPRLYPEVWTIEAQVFDALGRVHVSFHADGTCFRITAVEGATLADARDWARGLRPLDLAQPLEDVKMQIAREVQAARRSIARSEAKAARVAPEALPPPPADTVRVWYDSTPVPPELREPSGILERPEFADPFVDDGEADPFEDDGAGVPITCSGAVSSAADFEVLFEEPVDFEATVAGRTPIAPRAPRAETHIEAQLRAGPLTHIVHITQVSAGGVFAAMPLRSAPPVGARAVLGGFGARAVDARVVHHRSAQEGSWIGAPEGIGLAFAARDSAGLDQAGAYALVLMADSAARDRAVPLLVRAGYQIIIAENLLAAASAFYQSAIGLLVAEDAVEPYARVAETLDLVRRDLPVLWIGEGPPPARGVQAISPRALDAARFAALGIQRRATRSK